MSNLSRKWYRLETMFRLAESYSTLSTCKRLGVGCVISSSGMGKVLSVGYNGPPAAISNDSCRNEQGKCGCVHAEANALSKLPEVEGATLLVTTAPCLHCAGMIMNSGKIIEVIYSSDYRESEGIELLKQNIKCTKYREAVPQVIVVGEREKFPPHLVDSNLTLGEGDFEKKRMGWWRKSLCNGGFKTSPETKKLAKIGLDVFKYRSANLCIPAEVDTQWDGEWAYDIARFARMDQPNVKWVFIGRSVAGAFTRGIVASDFGKVVQFSTTSKGIIVPDPNHTDKWWNSSVKVESMREKFVEFINS